MRQLKKTYCRKNTIDNFTYNEETMKKHTRKSILTHLFNYIAIVFDLDNTLIKTAYKKHKLSDYDCSF